MKVRLLTPVITGAAALALLLSGCAGAGSMAKADVEEKIKTQLTAQVGQEPDSIECPDDLLAEVGATMTCVLTAGDTKLEVTATVTAVEGTNISFDIKVADEPMK